MNSTTVVQSKNERNAEEIAFVADSREHPDKLKSGCGKDSVTRVERGVTNHAPFTTRINLEGLWTGVSAPYIYIWYAVLELSRLPRNHRVEIPTDKHKPEIVMKKAQMYARTLKFKIRTKKQDGCVWVAHQRMKTECE